MTTTQEAPSSDTVERSVRRMPPERSFRGWFPQFMRRLHFYAAIFVGPFILIAALSGAAYAAAPTVESVIYHQQLTTSSRGEPLSLATQVGAAQRYVERVRPGDELLGVKPAARPGATTQVMFSEHGLREGQVRSVWIDPVTGDPRGDLTTTSTALPVSEWLDVFHRNLFLGDLGRTYSELAASWLGIITLAGLGLWVVRFRATRHKRKQRAAARRGAGYRRNRSLHAAIGVWLALGALFLSATGITWSLHAGANVDKVQSALSWSKPALTGTVASGASDATYDGSAQRQGRHLAVLDEVLAKARRGNIQNAQVEIDLPNSGHRAWTVQEVRRSHPVAANAVSIDPKDMSVVSQTDWDSFPLAAKLTTWGINAHMGLLFGLVNQVLLFLLGIGLAALIVLGYVMWWQRRPARGGRKMGRRPERGSLQRAPRWGQSLVAAVALGVGLLLPEVGVTLLAFLLVDALVMAAQNSSGAN